MLLKVLELATGLIFGNMIFLVASVVPKNRKLWVFSAWNGQKYLDNPKYIYRFINESNSDVRAVWVTKDQQLCSEMRQQGLPVVYAFSLRGIVCQLRAKIVVFTHSVAWEFLPFLIGYGVKRVQTWHGMPIKKIGFDDSKNNTIRARLRTRILMYENERFDLVIAASGSDKARYCTAFNTPAKNVRITGYPRNDEIIRSMVTNERPTEQDKKVIYMPTFRGAPGSEFKLLEKSRFDFDRADSLFDELKIEFYIKLHPVQIFSKRDHAAMEKSSRIHTIDNVGDIYEQIGTYDILITDFSGIYFDFMITGKPIIMAPLDLANYLQNDRELYYAYEDICPDKSCTSWNEVFVQLREKVRINCSSSETYLRLRDRFHVYRDADSSARVYDQLKQLSGRERSRELL